MWAQAAEGAGGAQGRPCILHQPRPSDLKTGLTGLGSRATWAPAQSAGRAGRRPGVGGQGLFGPPSAPGVWEPGALAPPQVLLGGLPASWVRGALSGSGLASEAQLQILHSVLRPAAQTGGWENSPPGKPWPQGGKNSLPGPGARLLSQLLLGPAALWPTPLLPAHLHQTGHQALTRVALGGATQAGTGLWVGRSPSRWAPWPRSAPSSHSSENWSRLCPAMCLHRPLLSKWLCA